MHRKHEWSQRERKENGLHTFRVVSARRTKPVHPKGNQFWIFIGRTDAETEAPILWPPDAKNQLIRQDLDAGKGWGQEEKGTTEDDMVGWHHRLNGHEFEQALGVGEGQGSLAWCSSWGRKEMDMTELLNSKNHVYGDKSVVFLWPIILLSWSPHPYLVCFRVLLSCVHLLAKTDSCMRVSGKLAEHRMVQDPLPWGSSLHTCSLGESISLTLRKVYMIS